MRQGIRFAPRNWRLRSKQTVVVVVPLLVALALGAVHIGTEINEADEYDRAVAQIELSTTLAELIDEIQLERDLVVGGMAADRRSKPAQTTVVDRQVAEFREQRETFEDLDPTVRARYERVTDGLDTLTAIRALSRRPGYPAADAVIVYGRVVTSLLQLSREITWVTDDRAINQQADSVDAITRAKEQAAIQNSLLRVAAIDDSFSPEALTRLRTAQARFTAAIADFEESASPSARARYTNTVAGADVGERLRLHQVAQHRGESGAPLGIDVATLDASANGTIDKLRQVETVFLEELHDTATGLVTTARNDTIRAATLIGGALLIALLVMLIVSRSLLRPLRVLGASAHEVASVRLPAAVDQILAAPDPVRESKDAVAPVPVHTREETGALARSFDAVHGQAVRMTVEQALLRDNLNSIFVNLSRRGQVLVERLLSVVDRLGREQLDPRLLTSLLEIDHLATRMRRNSESLLVLSGTGLGRQLNRPVPVAEVVGAAVSEVEHYARIDVATAPEVAVDGSAANDLVHLIAELLDNATFFSESDKKVSVRAALSISWKLTIQISDRGVGMSEKDIALTNARLADPPAVAAAAVTRRMGLHVVARLARKHGITVRLRENPDFDGGLIACIAVPTALVIDPPVRTTAGVTARSRLTVEETSQPVPPEVLFGRPMPEEPILELDTPTIRLPIYEAVLSRWFDAEPAEPSWASPIDNGWQAAQALLDEPTDDEQTGAGLPKRVSGARLMPGSAAAQEAPAAPKRSPESVRGRMSQFQQGVLRGRHALIEEPRS